MKVEPGNPALAFEARRTASRRSLGAALVATLAASGWLALADDQPQETAPPTVSSSTRLGRDTPRPTVSSPAASAAPPSAWPAPPQTRQGLVVVANSGAWDGPPEPPPAATPAPVPVVVVRPFVGPVMPAAPPFAYTLIGRLDDGQPRALFTGPNRSFDARAGEIVDRDWRVDAVTPDGVTITWLPAGQKQRIGFKSS